MERAKNSIASAKAYKVRAGVAQRKEYEQNKDAIENLERLLTEKSTLQNS